MAGSHIKHFKYLIFERKGVSDANWSIFGKSYSQMAVYSLEFIMVVQS